MSARKRSYGRGCLVQKRPGGTYYTRIYVGGKQRDETTRTTDFKEATRILNERLGAVATGHAPAPGMGRVTITDLLDDLIVHQEVEQAPSVRSTRTHKVALETVPPGLGGIRAADLTTKHLQKFVTACRKDGNRCDGRPGPYAEASIGRFLDTLKSAMNLGRETTPPKVQVLPKFPEIDESGNVRQGWCTVAQANVIFDTLAAREQDLCDAVEWKFWTGMRKGAVSRLGWDLWDHETEMLRLPPGGRKKRTPKAVPLRKGHPLRAILDRRWERRKERARETGKLEPLIFWRVYQGNAPRPKKGQPALRKGDAVPVYEYRKAWRTAVTAAGCPNLTVHDLRRTAIRNSWHATHDRKTAMLLSGHVHESTFDRYNIDSGTQLVGHLDQIADYVKAQPQTSRSEVPTLPRAKRRAGHRS
jgi:hypothetical protein